MLSKVLGFASLVAFSAPAAAHGLKVEITRPGFALVSDVARTEFVNNLQNAALPDLEMRIPFVSRIAAQDITYSVTLGSLDVAPADGEIDVDALIDNVTVNIGSVRFESWLIPLLGSTCTGTSVVVGGRSGLPVSVQMNAGVNDEGLSLSLRRLDFALNHDQYAAQGPGDCRGPFDVKDYFTRFVASFVIAHARPLIEAGVRIEARRLVPQVQKMLNELSEKPLIVGTPDLIVAPATRVALKGKATQLDLSSEGMTLELALTVDKAPESRAANRRRLIDRVPHEPGQLYATLGVHPALVSQILAVTLANGSRATELTRDMDPMIESLTDRSALAAFWPDLDKTVSTGQTLRLFARIVQPPVISALECGLGWRMAVPDLELHYQLNRDGVWIDYVDLHIKAEMDAAPSIQDGQLAMKLLSGTASATSVWAPTYTPVDPRFDQEMTNSVLKAVFELISTSETPPTFMLPTIALAGYALTAEKLRIDGEYTKIDLIEAPR